MINQSVDDVKPRRLETERGDRTARHGHELSDLPNITCELQNLTIEIVGLLIDGFTCLFPRKKNVGWVPLLSLGIHQLTLPLPPANPSASYLIGIP
jgi:hypothetical protein